VAQQEFSEHPEFYSAPGSASETGAQRNDKGNLTPAGDESLPLLQSLVSFFYTPGFLGPFCLMGIQSIYAISSAHLYVSHVWLPQAVGLGGGRV